MQTHMRAASCCYLRRRITGVLTLSLLFAAAIVPATYPPAGEDESEHEHWVGTWSNALHQPDLGVPGLATPASTIKLFAKSCTSASEALECACVYPLSERVAW